MMEFIAREPIDKGWSCDKKYRVTAADGTIYLLRVTQGEKAASRAEGFRMQQQVAALVVPMCRPVAKTGGNTHILEGADTGGTGTLARPHAKGGGFASHGHFIRKWTGEAPVPPVPDQRNESERLCRTVY